MTAVFIVVESEAKSLLNIYLPSIECKTMYILEYGKHLHTLHQGSPIKSISSDATNGPMSNLADGLNWAVYWLELHHELNDSQILIICANPVNPDSRSWNGPECLSLEELSKRHSHISLISQCEVPHITSPPVSWQTSDDWNVRLHPGLLKWQRVKMIDSVEFSVMVGFNYTPDTLVINGLLATSAPGWSKITEINDWQPVAVVQGNIESLLKERQSAALIRLDVKRGGGGNLIIVPGDLVGLSADSLFYSRLLN